MPRYFLDLLNGTGLTPDEEGAELADVSAARQRAIREARALMASEVLHGRLDLSGRILVYTEARELALELSFDEAVTVSHSDDEEAEGAP